MKKIASTTDPLWYKDAVIYELHVRAFADSNNDGIGDFPGLMSRLDYLKDLGITCIWLLPFFPSPLRDDGYDISNYNDVNPSYGTLSDFKAFLDAAHHRGLQVMIELVINHTSDQHPWFKAARQSPPDSAQRNMYVWSDTAEKYKDARIIFTDTEKSNWTWDETAKAYYWHRFFSHQPDLNFDNPAVLEEVLKAMRFWLDMGVDALRMDAIPYLCERDGTSCENLPETHTVIKALRAEIDAGYSNRLILAEANQWPADVRPYFGDGDECHMAFHFPLMPRIYMALRQEDRLPITDIMAQTPSIPDNCQWGLFLRNHDELTLEMVTDDERDYMYFAYSADPRMRVNVGIRRRLAPLVDNNRRRIELLNSLLLSFPGTPILYYGDEIGMGDNIYLGDRNGVRTPMQWTSDRNAGFSKCDPARLYLPVVMDPIYGYQVLNVEAQLGDQSSLLHWTRNMIALRKLFQVFGRGTLAFLNPSNRKILAYLRELQQGDGFCETVLCVANLSRFAQPVTLDLAKYAGYEPVEMLGYVRFPAISSEPYSLTLAPYSFIWLELQATAAVEHSPSPVAMQTNEPATQDANILQPVFANGWEQFISGGGAAILEPALLEWLPNKRWFGAKSRKIESVSMRGWVDLSSDATPAGHSSKQSPQPAAAQSALFFFEVTYSNGSPDIYQIPLAVSTGAALDEKTASQPESIVAKLTTPAGPAILYDATISPEFHQELFDLIARNATSPLLTNGKSTEDTNSEYTQPSSLDEEAQAVPVGAAVVPAPLSAQPGDKAPPPRTESAASQSPPAIRSLPRESPSAPNSLSDSSLLHAQASSAFSSVLSPQRSPSRVSSSEQSNTSIIYGKQFFLKIYRRLQPEENPDVEIGRYLTEVAHFTRVPPFLGEISLSSGASTKTTLALLQGLVENQGDGFQWYLDQLAAWLPTAAQQTAPPRSISPAWLSEPLPIPVSLEPVRSTLQASALLGTRTAELHLALSSGSALAAFATEPLTGADLAHDSGQIELQIKSAFEALKLKLPRLDDSTSDLAGLLLSRRPQLIQRANSIRSVANAGQRIRIHGDYHLGQTLRVAANGDPSGTDKNAEGDIIFIDFEGEPARPIEERRRKQSPLKDVVGMMRSFAYAAFSAVDHYVAEKSGEHSDEDRAALLRWAQLWQNVAISQFLSSYRKAMAAKPNLLPHPNEAQTLLDAYLLEKALYELQYELDNRPSWVKIPLSSMLA